MEALAAAGLPHLLQLAYNTLEFAWKQYNDVEERKAQCKLILERCQDLLVEVANQSRLGHLTSSTKADLYFIERACLAAKTAIAHISGKSFAWRLLHQGSISQNITEAEDAVAFACTKFNLQISAHLEGHRLQSDFSAAREQDHRTLVSYLQSIAKADRKILEALQQDGKERRQLQELVVALAKHVQNVVPMSSRYDEPAEAFVRTASMALQRLSKQTDPVDIPRWSVTSLEVTFDRNDEDSCIGRGGFGRIFKGEWHGQLVAIKEMHWEDARAISTLGLKAIRHEISIWSQLTHPHILPFYCACLEASQPFMVSKLCSYGNVLEFLRAFPHVNRVCILDEIALGMNYLHIQGIIHADLKASNVLIGDDGKALIADFGLSRFQDQMSSWRSNASTSKASRCGSERWMSPERLDGERPSKSSDVYSFAITAWELFTGNVPFDQVPDRALIRKVVDKRERPPRPPLLTSDRLWGLVQQSWDADPNIRPLFDVLHIRLKPLSQTSCDVSVLGASTSSIPSSGGDIKLGLPAVMTPVRISPVPPLAALPTFESLKLAENREDDVSILSPERQTELLVAALSTHGLSSKRITTLSSLELLSRSERGRTAMYKKPQLLEQFGKLLSSSSSGEKEIILACTVNIAWGDDGKRAILASSEMFSSMISVLWHGSSIAKEYVAHCLSRILTLELTEIQNLLFQSSVIQALRNLLTHWSTAKEKEQAARCLVYMSCSVAGQKILIAEYDLALTLLKLLSHGTPDAKQNAARCLANLATCDEGQLAILGLPDAISRLDQLLLPTSSCLETEQATRCLQYLTCTEEGRVSLISESKVISRFSQLMRHESSVVQKHTAGCCRNLCHSAFGVDAISTQRGLLDTLTMSLSSRHSDIKDYVLATLFWIIHHCMDLDTPVDLLPVQGDRSGFLLALQELLLHTSAQAKAAACLRRLCSDALPRRRRSRLTYSQWASDIAYRPNLLLALADPSFESLEAIEEASHCLALVALQADDQMRQSFFSQPDILPRLAMRLSSRSESGSMYTAQCLTSLAASDIGQRTINRQPEILSTLKAMRASLLTSKSVKAQVGSCLRNLNHAWRPSKA